MCQDGVGWMLIYYTVDEGEGTSSIIVDQVGPLFYKKLIAGPEMMLSIFPACNQQRKKHALF